MKRILSHQYFPSVFWVFFGNSILNGGNFLYHFLMGRMLGPQLYGTLESAISFLYILSIPMVTLSLVAVKFVSSYKGKEDTLAISGIYFFLQRSILIFGSSLSLILLLCSPLILSFLHLPSFVYIVFLIVSFFLGFLLALNRSFLQGIFSFYYFSLTNIVETVSKVVFGTALVFIGLRAEGAFGGIVISIVAAYIVSYLLVRKKRLRFVPFSDHKALLAYTPHVLVTTLAMTSLMTTDVLLVRHYFSGVESGYYAALSILGKIIYFAVFPVSLIMFPLISEHYARGRGYGHVLGASVGVTSLGIGSILAIYFLFPQVMVRILFGESFSAITSLLGFFGIFIGLYSLSYLLVSFYLSIHKTVVSIVTGIAAVVQILLIALFHSSLYQVIQVSIVTTACLLIALFVYYPIGIKRRLL